MSPQRHLRPPPSDLDRAIQIAFDPGSNQNLPVEPPDSTRISSQPSDLDPTDQIHPFDLTALFCLKAHGFYLFHKNTLPPYRFLYN
jgi:hypothetical protein